MVKIFECCHLSLFVYGGMKSLISTIANGWVLSEGGSPIGRSPMRDRQLLGLLVGKGGRYGFDGGESIVGRGWVEEGFWCGAWFSCKFLTMVKRKKI